VTALLWHGWPEEVRLVTELLLQPLRLFVNLSLLPSSLLFFALLLLLLLLKELKGLTLFFRLSLSSGFLCSLRLPLLLTRFSLDLGLQACSLGVDLPLCPWI
jgi:hypothetical protein